SCPRRICRPWHRLAKASFRSPAHFSGPCRSTRPKVSPAVSRRPVPRRRGHSTSSRRACKRRRSCNGRGRRLVPRFVPVGHDCDHVAMTFRGPAHRHWTHQRTGRLAMIVRVTVSRVTAVASRIAARGRGRSIIGTLIVVGTLIACAVCWYTAATAQAPGNYPNRPVRVIVPFAVAGPTDIMARLMAQKLSERTGRQFYVENVPGAGGNMGMGQAASAHPDGYTILFVSSSFVVNPSLYATVPYDPIKDFEPVTLAAVT